MVLKSNLTEDHVCNFTANDDPEENYFRRMLLQPHYCYLKVNLNKPLSFGALPKTYHGYSLYLEFLPRIEKSRN